MIDAAYPAVCLYNNRPECRSFTRRGFELTFVQVTIEIVVELLSRDCIEPCIVRASFCSRLLGPPGSTWLRLNGWRTLLNHRPSSLPLATRWPSQWHLICFFWLLFSWLRLLFSWLCCSSVSNSVVLLGEPLCLVTGDCADVPGGRQTRSPRFWKMCGAQLVHVMLLFCCWGSLLG